MNTVTLFILTLSGLTLFVIFFIILKFRKTMVYHYALLDNIASETYNSKLGEIEYLLKGEGPPILVSHGITGGVDQGLGLSKDYLGSGYQFLFVSRFGYLNSSKPDNASAKLQADFYKELIDYLGIKKVFVFGNSAGSTSALHFAINYPSSCAGLVLVSPNAPLDVASSHPPRFVFRFNFLYWVMMKLLGRWMLNLFVPKAVLIDLSKQEVSQLINDLYFSALPVSKRYRGIVFDLFVSNPSINGKVSFDRIGCPVLIFNAVDDPATLVSGARTIAKNIKNSKLYAFNTGGHLLLGHKEEIRFKVSDFVSTNS